MYLILLIGYLLICVSYWNVEFVLFFLSFFLCVGKFFGIIYCSDFFGLGCDMLLNKMKLLNYLFFLVFCLWYYGYYLYVFVFVLLFWFYSCICFILY